MSRSKQFTPKFLATLFCLIGILLTSCTSFSPLSTPKPTKAPLAQQVYRATIPFTDIPTLDPGEASDTISTNTISMIFTGLVQLDDNLNVQPQMAQSYQASPNGLTYTFHLKTSLHFSDGMPLTSQDVAYSTDRALSPSVAKHSGVSSTYLGLLQGAAVRTNGTIPTLINNSILTPDDNTVILKLSKPARYFLSALAYPTSYVVEKSVIDKWGPNWTDHLADNGGKGGDGPFKVKSYNHGKSLVLVPNPRYYDHQPQLQEVDQSFYPSPQTNYIAYQAGQADVTAIPLTRYPQARHSKEFSQNNELAIEYIAMNYLVKPFDNIKIRQAFELALNKAAIVKDIWKGTFTPTCHIVPSGIHDYKPHLQCPANAPDSGDKVMAKQLLNEGLHEEGLTLATLPPLTITYANGLLDLQNEVTTEQQMWQDVLGVTVKAQTLAYPSLFMAISNSVKNTHGLQMWVASWSADYPDPQDWLTLQFGHDQPYNAVNYGNNTSSSREQQKQTQGVMDAADVISHTAARFQAYSQIEQQLINDVAWLPLYQRSGFRLRKSYVIGFPKISGMVPPDDWANIYIAIH